MAWLDAGHHQKLLPDRGLVSVLQAANLDPKDLKKAKAAQQADFPDGIEQCGTDALRFALVSYTSQVNRLAPCDMMTA